MRFLRAVVAPLALTGCTATAAPVSAASGLATTCSDPRPQVCTRVCDPVCATVADGERATYASGRTACADAEVRSHVSGPCPE